MPCHTWHDMRCDGCNAAKVLQRLTLACCIHAHDAKAKSLSCQPPEVLACRAWRSMFILRQSQHATKLAPLLPGAMTLPLE